MSNSITEISGTPQKARKVLIVCTVPTSRSGIPSVIFNLLSAIDRSGLQFHYVSISPMEPYVISILN